MRRERVMRRREAEGTVERLTTTLRRRGAYYRAEMPKILDENISNIRIACAVTVVLVVLLWKLAEVMVPGWAPTGAHVGLFVSMVALIVVGHVIKGASEGSVRLEAAYCFVAQVTFLLFALLLDTVCSAGAPSAFMQPICIGVTALIALPYGVPVIVAAVFEALYLVLCLMAHQGGTAFYEVFAVVTGLGATIAVSQIVINLRVCDYEARSRFMKLSMVDSLTGILNRGALVSSIRSRIDRDFPVVSGTLLLFDLDDFKGINDKCGHSVGDEVLIALGDILRSSFRSTDLVGRFGGDEFIVYAPELSDVCVARRKVEEVLSRMKVHMERAAGEGATCSAGVVVAEGAQVVYEELFSKADSALYEAKHAGKASYVLRGYGDGVPPAPRHRRCGGSDEVDDDTIGMPTSARHVLGERESLGRGAAGE